MTNSILQSALDSEIIPNLDGVKEDIDVIIKGVSKSWSPFKATVASVFAKLTHPDWDTRLHQLQIGGKHSLRTIDTDTVEPFLHSRGLYDTATTFALTRSFEHPEPYNETYSGNFRPPDCKKSFLKIVKTINTTADPILLNNILIYMLQWLKKRQGDNNQLKETIVESNKQLNFRDISSLCNFVIKLGSGSSVVPVIMVHCVLSISNKNMTIKALKEHTAPDNHSKAYGDVEGFIDGEPVVAVEVKHKIKINDTIIRIFDEKTKEIRLKFIVTTAKISHSITASNIWVDSLENFVLRHLHQALVHEKDICLLFIKKFREDVVNYPNIGTEIKRNINDHLTTLLVSPSP